MHLTVVIYLDQARLWSVGRNKHQETKENWYIPKNKSLL